MHCMCMILISHTGCNPQQLSDDRDMVASDVTMGCGAALHTLGTRNGIVCYDNIDVGASAVYSCSCDSRVISIRTCLLNGSWSGTIPQCECGKL